MKIVIATAVYYPMINGVAVFSHNLATGLARRGHKVLVLCPSQTGDSYIEKKDGAIVAYLNSTDLKVYPDQIHEVPEKVKIHGKEMPRLFYRHGLKASLLPKREIERILNKFRPDVIHVQVSDPIGIFTVAYGRKHEIPVVTTEHNQPEVLTEPMHVPEVLRGVINTGLSGYFRARQKKSDYVTMPTEQAIDNLIRKNGKRFPVPVEAVSNGVDLMNFKPKKVEEEVYRKWGVSEKDPIAIYVGRVDPEKKVGVIIRAFLKVLNRVPGAKLLIVGDGVERLKLEKVVEGRGLDNSIKFLGRVLPLELYEIYQIGQVFVTASEIETQGITLIEAAATGLPLVAVNKGAVIEVCRNGENGFLCEPKNINEISEAITKILTDKKLREKFSENSLKIAEEHDFERTLDKFIKIYKRLLYDKV